MAFQDVTDGPEVDTHLDGDRLHAEVVWPSHQQNDKYFFYLLRNGEVHTRLGWTDSRKSTFNLRQSGLYSIQAHLKRSGSNLCRISAPTYFRTNELEQEFYAPDEPSMGLSQDKTATLPLFLASGPYIDFAVVRHTNNRPDSLMRLLNNSTLQAQSAGTWQGRHWTLVAPDAPAHVARGHLFSGVARTSERLVFGAADIASTQDIHDLKASIGNFALLEFTKDPSSLSISLDYFGIAKIYYYHADGIFCCSTSYHLLLKLLRFLGVHLDVNHDKCLATLAVSSVQPFHQNFSREMDVNGVRMLTPDRSIRIDDTGISFPSTPLIRDLCAAQESAPPTTHEYSTLLRRACDEIIDNTRIALAHPGFETVLVDLSGGMDSRTVYAAATNLPDYREKIRIAANRLDEVPEDLTTALAVNSCYDFPYDTTPTGLTSLDPSLIRSAFLGTYYSFIPVARTSRSEQAIRLTGFYGEICARPYYSRQHLSTSLDVRDAATFARQYVSLFAHTSVAGNENGAIQKLEQVFAKELGLLPGRTALEKLELHYLFYRGALHCSDRWRTEVTGPEWGPLQSKTLFQLKHRTFLEYKSTKVQHDLIEMLNPIISKIPYARPEDNSEKDRLRGSLVSAGGIFSNLRVTPVGSQEKWELARSEKRRNVVVKSADAKTAGVVGIKDLHSLRRMLLTVESELRRTDESVSLCAIYDYLRTCLDSPARTRVAQYLTNKIMSIYYQIGLCN